MYILIVTVYHSSSITTVVSIVSTSPPNQPVMHCITFTDVFNQTMNIPLDWFSDRKVM